MEGEQRLVLVGGKVDDDDALDPSQVGGLLHVDGDDALDP